MVTDAKKLREWFQAEERARLGAPLERIVRRVEEHVDARFAQRDGKVTAAVGEDDPREGAVYAVVKLGNTMRAELSSLDADDRELVQNELRRRYFGSGFEALVVDFDAAEVQLGCDLNPDPGTPSKAGSVRFESLREI